MRFAALRLAGAFFAAFFLAGAFLAAFFAFFAGGTVTTFLWFLLDVFHHSGNNRGPPGRPLPGLGIYLPATADLNLAPTVNFADVDAGI